ncbi:uncharacterized protein LOC114438415 [Parambassis ranga]|uniref:Uncharacterized protein LOC114438415 n=1 Tax=Parambassis ranga TaxID=210632 RepID=A0A6P7IBD5_9TELE|nr:uncharacterized protein LOC114438415 [Parambassis ranga]
MKMEVLLLILLFRMSLQLQCDKTEITAHVGGEFILACQYDSSRYLYSKKYWCRGDSRNTCQILVHSEEIKRNTQRSHIIERIGRRALFVRVTNLRLDDADVYWVGIDKIYADIMTSVKVVITEVPVSKPALWPLSSLEDRPTCDGKPVTVRCGCAKGTGVQYAWYQAHTHREPFLLHSSSDLYLHCRTVEKKSDYYCVASNDMSSLESDVLSVQVLLSAGDSCIYVVNIQGQPFYDCMDRMSTTTVTAPPVTSCQAPTEFHPESHNQSLLTNDTQTHLIFSRSWTGVPFWYMLLRWGALIFLTMFLCIVVKCTKQRHKNMSRRRR